MGDRTAGALARALDGPSLRALGRVVSQIAAGRPVSEVPQDHARATQAPRPSGDLLRLDRAWSTERALRRIRALSPIPGLPLQVAGLDFFVTRASPAPRFTPALDPGEGEVSSSRILLRTVDGAIQVDEAFLVDGRRVSGLELATRLKSRG